MSELEGILQTALRACHRAGEHLRSVTAEPRVVEAVLSHDIKARADRETEAVIRRELSQDRPQDAILGEEEGGEASRNGGLWIVDPIDGTINFVHRDPYFATTVAWARDGEVQAGVIHCPMDGTTYYALKGGGAYCDGRPIRVSETRDLSRAMLHVGCGKGESLVSNWRRLDPLVAAVHSVRFKCCATLDLCALAAGRCEGYCDMGLYLWDFAAGRLILEEAGGLCEAVPRPGEPGTFDVLAGVPGIFQELKKRFN